MSADAMSISQLQAESDRLQSLVGQIQLQLSDAQASLASVRSELQRRLKPQPEPRLSDHAMLRYLERVMHVDVKAIQARIMTDKVKAAILAGASSVIVAGAKFKIANNTVVTIIDVDAPPKMAKASDRGPSIAEGLRDHFEAERV